MKKAADAVPNARLVEERLKRHWSQQEVADRVGTTSINVSRWERGMSSPGAYFRHQLCTLFGKSSEELGLVPRGDKGSGEQGGMQPQEAPSSMPVASHLHWNVPYRRNLFFTGREAILQRLHDALSSGEAGVTQAYAISGLGGIGKTQTAIEYAYRYRDAYSAVLWARADRRENLLSDFVAIADMLGLLPSDEQDSSRAVESVKRWLHNHAGWLFILDNAEDLTMTNEFLTPSSGGHILLTTRSQIVGTLAQLVNLAKMGPEEGALFLLRRAKRIAPSASLADAAGPLSSSAREISRMMDGLPLALDQAGAYIEETMCDVSEYLHRYQSRRAYLLSLRGEVVTDHPAPVSVTFSLSIEKVEQAHPLAADLLRLCAFLHPDAIPEEILIEGAAGVGDPLAFDAAIKELRKFSLLQRNPATKMFTVHRLVQEVLRDGMDAEIQRQWAGHAIRILNRAFPDGEFATWQRCQQCLPHALACAALIEEWKLISLDAAQLLWQAGSYIYEQASFYPQAELLLQQSLAMYEQVLGPGHPDVARSVTYLGRIFHEQGKHELAEPLFQRALAIYEQALGPGHPDVARSVTYLAVFYIDQGAYERAEPLFQRALRIYEQSSQSNSLQAMQSLNTLAIACYHQGKYALAELFFQQVLTGREETLKPEHPAIAESLVNLGSACIAQEKYAQAQPLFQRALAIQEQVLEPGHPMIGVTLNVLAQVYYYSGEYGQAELLLQRALSIREQALGPESTCFAESLNNLADVYRAQRKFTFAEQYCRRALAIYSKVWGAEHLEIAQVLNTLAKLYRDQSKFAQAESYFQQAQAMREHILGAEHPHVARSLKEWSADRTEASPVPTISPIA